MSGNDHIELMGQKHKYDRAIRAKEYQTGVLVWVVCLYVPQKGSPKLMRGWRDPYRVVQVLDDGRVYIINTGRKVHFERPKLHQSGPTWILGKL